jgi:hypothetical protein
MQQIEQFADGGVQFGHLEAVAASGDLVWGRRTAGFGVSVDQSEQRVTDFGRGDGFGCGKRRNQALCRVIYWSFSRLGHAKVFLEGLIGANRLFATKLKSWDVWWAEISKWFKVKRKKMHEEI